MQAPMWMAVARCRSLDSDVFFPRDGVGVEAAKTVCSSCPVRQQCLEYAVANGIEHGVWGGASERERRRIRAARKRANPAGVEAGSRGLVKEPASAGLSGGTNAS